MYLKFIQRNKLYCEIKYLPHFIRHLSFWFIFTTPHQKKLFSRSYSYHLNWKRIFFITKKNLILFLNQLLFLPLSIILAKFKIVTNIKFKKKKFYISSNSKIKTSKLSCLYIIWVVFTRPVQKTVIVKIHNICLYIYIFFFFRIYNNVCYWFMTTIIIVNGQQSKG